MQTFTARKKRFNRKIGTQPDLRYISQGDEFPGKKRTLHRLNDTGSLMVPGNQMTATRGVSVILPRFPFPSAFQLRHYS